MEDVIVQAARTLDNEGVLVHQLGIHFAQIGDDIGATEMLKQLDTLDQRYAIRVRQFGLLSSGLY